MEDKWRDDLVGLLKFLEKCTPRPNSVKIHEFRRSLESCNIKKAEKILPQLKEIYTKCKDHLNSDFDSWVSQQKFTLKLGLKSITISSIENIEEYAQYLKWCFSIFDPSLNEGNPNNIVQMAKGSGLPISGKQLKIAMRKVNNMDTKQLSSMMNRVPQNQLEALASNPGAGEFVNKLKEDKRAQAVAEKIQAIQNNN
jgi:hypothetical protein